MKKLFALLLGLLMVQSAFAACSQGVAGGESTTASTGADETMFQTTMAETTTQTTVAETTVAATTEAPPPEPEDTKLGIPLMAENATLRVISHNILLQSLRPSTDRADKLKMAVENYDADVVALQEVDDLWHKSVTEEGYGLDEMMSGLGYSMVPLVSASGEWSHCKDVDNRNPIYYHTETLKLIECGYDRYEATKAMEPEKPSSAYTWALLEEIATGKRFIVISTHFIAGKDCVDLRTQSAQELAAFVEELKGTYGVPVMSVGDYNCNADTDAYGEMISSGLLTASESAAVRVNTQYSTAKSFSLAAGPAHNGAIDHCFHTPEGFTLTHFEILNVWIAYIYSDHVPLLIDFALT